MGRKPKIKIGNYIHLPLKEGKSNLNILFKITESNKKHFKVEWCKIPSKVGKKPKSINRSFFWTSETHLNEYVKKNNGLIINELDAKNYLKNGL